MKTSVVETPEIPEPTILVPCPLCGAKPERNGASWVVEHGKGCASARMPTVFKKKEKK